MTDTFSWRIGVGMMRSALETEVKEDFAGSLKEMTEGKCHCCNRTAGSAFI